MFQCGLFETSQELVTRLRRSVIMYGTLPVFVEGVEEKSLLMTALLTGKALKVESSSDKLNLNSLPLGYVNTREGALYIRRRPVRLYKQGICSENLCTSSRSGVPERVLRSKAFAKMLINSYPTFSEVVTGSGGYVNPFEPSSTVKAFHRSLASDGKNLYHKGRLVGKIRPDKTFSLTEKFTYLREDIEECLNEC